MESAEKPVGRFRIHGTIRKCFREGDRWYVQIEGSWESLCLGPVEFAWSNAEQAYVPVVPFAAGDAVDIVIERRK